jgi:tRNA1Val (adenine37-N6)-methyltransferase
MIRIAMARDDSNNRRPDISEDQFMGGSLQVAQPVRGYRFSIDAVLLADYVRPPAGASLVDLGTGCGILPLILARRHAELTVLGIDIQPELAALARRNVTRNRLEGRIRIECRDLKEVTAKDTGGQVDWVISNPPYRPVSSGRINPDPQRAAARHELRAALPDIVAAAARLLRLGGRLGLIYPAERLTDLLVGMRQAALEPKHLQPVQSSAAGAIQLILATGIHGARPGLKISPPLVLYGPDGAYTAAVQAMFRAG